MASEMPRQVVSKAQLIKHLVIEKGAGGGGGASYVFLVIKYFSFYK